ncbi:inhibitor of nuclear factor kappa-B kinase subunit alpha-like [Oppia nitens]|uniref:inhibitor of nuclear factor kappa-B kinase subunit alpha-like n=1 Tax=Oppia nitens TaxID=1686743 RepID=UPI0023D9B7DA|nr:inhibitor of nuclear factor kappa-B kinase subunit alpha-like [Oppia nitens]
MGDSDVIIEKWRREQILGSGGFGVVSLWTNTETNEKIALKQCRWSDTNAGMTAKHKERWKQEVDIMQRLNCPNVVRAVTVPTVLDLPKSELPILGMEFCSGGDLRRVLNKPANCCGLNQLEVRQILRQVSTAIEYLHSLRIIHRDLKPENVVLQPQTDGSILYKLIDLGYAKELDQSSLCSSFVGTLQYLAPELFLSKQYSSAVDNWSFGLLAHEIIVGRRPFLPNYSPAQWIPIVSKKSSTDICANVDAKGNVTFSKEISQYNQICSSLKFILENYLRMVLEWEPKKRGGKEAFQMLAQILNKYIVEVFVVNTLEYYSYEITEETRLLDLQLLIDSNTSINCNNQRLILPKGLIPQENIGKQIIDNWYKRGETENIDIQPISILLFDKSKVPEYNSYSACVIPQSIEEIMLNPTGLMPYEEQKNAWRHAIWVAQQATKKYRTLHEGFKSFLMTCLSSQNAMQKLSQKVNIEFNKLYAITQFFKNSIKMNLENCEKCANISSLPLLRSSKEALIELSEAYAMSETINSLFAKSHLIVTKVIDAQRNPQFNAFIKSKPIDESIYTIYESILFTFDQLRKRSKEERNKKSDNEVMVKLLCECFQTEEKLMKDIYSNIRKIIDILRQIESHERDLQLILKSVSQSTHKLNLLQLKVQNDLWSYINSEVKNKPLNNNINCNSIGNSSEELVKENERLMKSIETIISRMNSFDGNDSSDDSFVHFPLNISVNNTTIGDNTESFYLFCLTIVFIWFSFGLLIMYSFYKYVSKRWSKKSSILANVYIITIVGVNPSITYDYDYTSIRLDINDKNNRLIVSLIMRPIWTFYAIQPKPDPIYRNNLEKQIKINSLSRQIPLIGVFKLITDKKLNKIKSMTLGHDCPHIDASLLIRCIEVTNIKSLVSHTYPLNAYIKHMSRSTTFTFNTSNVNLEFEESQDIPPEISPEGLKQKGYEMIAFESKSLQIKNLRNTSFWASIWLKEALKQHNGLERAILCDVYDLSDSPKGQIATNFVKNTTKLFGEENAKTNTSVTFAARIIQQKGMALSVSQYGRHKKDKHQE